MSKKIVKCEPDKHEAGILSHNNEHLVCEKCLEIFDYDFDGRTTLNPKIIEYGKYHAQNN